MSLGLYVHLPFCRVHCSYCPFAISTDLELQDRYVDALIREIESRTENGARNSPRHPEGRGRRGGSEGPQFADSSIEVLRSTPERPLAQDDVIAAPHSAPAVHRPHADSIYFGGGTPSRTSIANLRRVVDALHAHYDIAADAEFSIEANPEDITTDALASWRSLGVNRLSIGVQSFDDDELRAIGRIHDAPRAQEAIGLAVSSGIRTSVDLILGLPHQSETSFFATLSRAVASGVGHISLYMLDLEETTPLQVQVAHGRVVVLDDETVAALYPRAIETLAAAGFRQYEISNFARHGEECRHNLRYWRRGEYDGFGIAAHSLQDETRFANTRNIRLYIADPERARDFHETLGDAERRREAIFLDLRQAGGMSYDALVLLCGQEGIEWADRGLRDGWLRRMDGRVAFTPSGFLLSNEYISQLF